MKVVALMRYEACGTALNPIIAACKAAGITVEEKELSAQNVEYTQVQAKNIVGDANIIITSMITGIGWREVRAYCKLKKISTLYIPHGRFAEWRDISKSKIKYPPDIICTFSAGMYNYAQACNWPCKMHVTGSARFEEIARLPKDRKYVYITPRMLKEANGQHITKDERGWQPWLGKACEILGPKNILLHPHYRDEQRPAMQAYCALKHIKVVTEDPSRAIAQSSVVIAPYHSTQVCEANAAGKPVIIMEVADKGQWCFQQLQFDNRSMFWKPTIGEAIELAKKLHTQPPVHVPHLGDWYWRKNPNAAADIVEIITKEAR